MLNSTQKTDFSKAASRELGGLIQKINLHRLLPGFQEKGDGKMDRQQHNISPFPFLVLRGLKNGGNWAEKCFCFDVKNVVKLN